MNVQALVPLIATVAYIPLFVILLANQPWSRKHKLFLMFLIPAVLWSFTTFLSRGDLLIHNKLLEVKIAVFLAILMMVQLHYFIRSFYQSDRVRIPVAYVFVAAIIGFAAADYIPRNVEIAASGTTIDYGPVVTSVFLVFLFTVGVKDIVGLLRRRKVTPDPAESNQITYLLGAISALAVFMSITITPLGEEFPVSHIGNLIVACVLTYAIVTHRLLDVRVILRQAVIYLVLYGGGIGIVLLLFSLVQRFVGFEFSFASSALTISLGIPVILLLVHEVRDLWQKKVEEAFIGERYYYRRQLFDFLAQIHNILTLKQLGSEFISLLAQSVDCRRACLLLPEAGNGAFGAQFSYPPMESNPMRELGLKEDSPVLAWLRREGTILPARNLAILPEFQSMWEEEREETRAAEVNMFVPLMNRGKLVAVLAISERRDSKLYALEDIDLLESVTVQVAASMEKEYSHERLREQDEEVALVNRLTAIITSSVSIQMIFEGFAQELRKVADVDFATIALIDGDELSFLALSTAVGSAWQSGEMIRLQGTATEYVCRERQTVYESDLRRHHGFWTGESYLQRGIQSVVYLPLNVADHCIGSLTVASREPNAYSNSQVRLLEKVAAQIAAPIENAQLYARMEEKSRVDVLTGLFNRRHFEEQMKEEVARHSRYGDVFSIFMIDLDDFKAYNDIHGHVAGDVLLGQIGRIIKSSVRSVDQAFRYGGDEFFVILPQTSKDDAHIVAERTRERINRETENKAVMVSCSIGLASYPVDGAVADELVEMADNALYHAKRTGGNRICLSSKTLPKPSGDGAITEIDTRTDALSTVYALVSAVEAREPYIYGHSRKVNTYAVALAQAIGLSPDEVSKVSAAALLHDIGKITIPDEVLHRRGKLDEEDWELIKVHPRLGANIVSRIPSLAPCMSSILHHHERWDGGGYPEGLRGEQIPLEARILAIADSFEAMTSPRPYRPALSLDESIKELREGAGTQFDPKLVEVFIGLVEAGLPGSVKTE
jgi:diguanylate cyclase (GGDEF)-like protein